MKYEYEHDTHDCCILLIEIFCDKNLVRSFSTHLYMRIPLDVY